MSNFKTIEELQKHNNDTFEQVFGTVTYKRPENPFEEDSWEALKFNARPHDVFRLDWAHYNSIRFANTFLPYVGGVEGKGLWMYDGAELFNDIRTATRRIFKFDDHKDLISLISYTYPKGVLIGDSKSKVQVREYEVLTFIQLDEYDNIELSFKFGRRFRMYIDTILKNTEGAKGINALEDKLYQTDVRTFKAFFDGQLVHHDMMRFVLHTIGIKLTGHYKLESNFAETQLKKVAKDLGKFPFVIFMLNIFGKDIEVGALLKLYHRLLEDDMPKPKIETTLQPLDGRKANYDSKTNTIYIWEQFIDEATLDKKASAKLLIALVEEYGHFIDDVLRSNLATNPVKDRDYLDEGAKFSFFFFNNDILKLKDITYAHGYSTYFEGAFTVSFDIVKQIAENLFSDTDFFDANPNQALEGFGAGFEPGSHGGIELEALTKEKVFNSEEVLQIYYGNWLRDYSQVLVGATVRITEEAKRKLEKDISNNHILQLLKQNTDKVSHDGWVELLEILAAKEFVFEAGEGKKGFTGKSEDYVKKFRHKYGRLTKDILGIYRPEEHIDNPKGLKDESKLPIHFNYEYPKGYIQERTLYQGELSASLGIDDTLNTKKYIYYDFENRPASATYLKEQVELAVNYGRNKDGFRHLGAALHVLEDYFAHTNYTELALIKAGNENIYPWVESMQGKDYTTIPVVTGVFLKDDTLASVLPKVANSMFPIGYHDYVQRKVGDRTFGDLFILALLKDLSDTNSEDIYLGFTVKDWLKGYDYFLTQIVDGKSAIIEKLGWFGRKLDQYIQRVSETFNTFNNLAFNLLLRSTDETIKETQTHTTNKKYGTDPTHTQIAKDAENHPLNGLAADLATVAVTDVGKKIKAIWQGNSNMNGETLANYIINTYFQHPKHTSWEEKLVTEWSKLNTATLKRLESPTLYEHSEQVLQRTITNEAVQHILEFFKS